MVRVLTICNFKFVYIDKKKKLGFYSFKTPLFEICIDQYYSDKWIVCLCNKGEEVIKEDQVVTMKDALVVANEYFQNLEFMDI